MERETLSNNTEYQERLREGRIKGASQGRQREDQLKLRKLDKESRQLHQENRQLQQQVSVVRSTINIVNCVVSDTVTNHV